MKETNLILKRKGGGSIIDHRPVFSANGETLYIVWKQDIRAYSTKTADFVQEFEHVERRIIKIINCPKNSDTIVGCTENGILIYWNAKTGIIKLTVNLDLTKKNVKIETFHIVTYTLANRTRVYNVVVSYVNSGDNERIYLEAFNYNDGSPITHASFNKNKGKYYVDVVGNNGENLIALGQSIFLLTIDSKTLKEIRFDRIGREITCLTGHPNEECVATGDVSGRVLLFKDLSLPFKQRNFLPQSTYHWHTLPVQEIAFSRSGGHMYTGGGECVLVKWSLDNVFNKSFLPRLPAPIKHLTIAPGNVYVAISTLDNGITIVDPQKKLISVIQNFTWGATPSSANLFPAGLIVDPRTNCLLLNSRTGHIQFYNTITKTLLYNMNITAQNLLTQERNAIIVNTEVTKISISSNGMWMATVEERDDQISSIELRLKFWEFDMERQIYVLNTSIELPHDVGVNSLLFQPGDSFGETNPFVVTTGKDEQFKLWNLMEPTSLHKKTKHWQCHSIGYYRNLPTNNAAFSEDGSLLGVGFDCTLTLWNPETMEFKKALSYFNEREPIKQIEFGKHEARHLMVVAYPGSLIVWDILTFRIKWSVHLKLSTLTTDPLSSYMAAFTTDNTLYVFKPTQSSYKYTQKQLIQNSSVLCSCFVPHQTEKRNSDVDWQKHSQLYFLDSNQELLTLEPEFESKSLLNNIISNENLPTTAFSRLLASKTISTKENMDPLIHDYLGDVGKGIVDELISVPAHTLPPMSLLCTSFLLSLNMQSSSKNKDIQKNETRQTLEGESDIEFEELEQNETADKFVNKVKQEQEEPVNSKIVTYDWKFLSEVIPISETI